jgi:diacylglycerol O-acyltransferase
VSTYPMDPVDAAWYHIDGPANLAMVTGVALTRQPLDFDKVREVYRHRLADRRRWRPRFAGIAYRGEGRRGKQRLL